jgi:hypothetical protein
LLFFAFAYKFLALSTANRAAEVNEMWKRRKLELDLEKLEKERSREKHRSRSPRSTRQSDYDKGKRLSRRGSGRHHENSSSRVSEVESVRGYVSDEVRGYMCNEEEATDPCHVMDDLRDEGLKEDEVEHFLHSRYDPYSINVCFEGLLSKCLQSCIY